MDFLLVRHSNIGSVLHRLGYFAAFMLMTPPLFTRLWGCSHWTRLPKLNVVVGVSSSISLRLISREIIFEVITVPERYRHTDGQTDRRLTVA